MFSISLKGTHAQEFHCPGENEEFYGCGACDSTCESDMACTMVRISIKDCYTYINNFASSI